MSDAVVPHRAPSNAPTARSGAGWFKRTLDSDIFYSFRRSRMTMVAAAVTVLFFLLAIFASQLAVQNPFDPAQLQLMNSRISPLWTADGQSPFMLGTDEQGRDVFSPILYGSRQSIAIGVMATLFAACFGIGWVFQLERDREHRQAVEGHPRGSVGLLQVAAGGQRHE